MQIHPWNQIAGFIGNTQEINSPRNLNQFQRIESFLGPKMDRINDDWFHITLIPHRSHLLRETGYSVFRAKQLSLQDKGISMPICMKPYPLFYPYFRGTFQQLRPILQPQFPKHHFPSG